MTDAVKREAKQEEDGAVTETEADLKGKKLSWGKLRGIDSFNIEAGRIPNIHDHGIKVSHISFFLFPGIGLLYSELVQGIPPIFRQFVKKIPSIHSVFVFISVKHIPISKVEPHERFLFRQLEPREFRLFKCVVRYGYRDAKETAKDFETSLIKQLKEFVFHEFFIREGNQPFPNYQSEEPGTETTETNRRIAEIAPDETLKPQGSAGSDSSGSILPANSNRSGNSSRIRAAALIPAIEEEKQFIQKEMEMGVVYLLGETEMVAKPSSSIIKRAVVNNMYQFIKRNFRQGDEAMSIPKSRLLKVGVTYEI